MSDETKKFDIKIVSDNFEAALHQKDDVQLKEYLDSFEELNRFFTLMGSIFGFVSSDLKEKMNLLSELLGKTENFYTVKNMIEYEKDNNLLNKEDYVSGSRTLLRLHRGLGKILFSYLIGEFSIGYIHSSILSYYMFVPYKLNIPDFIQLFLKKIGDLESTVSTSRACKEAYDQTLSKHHPFLIRTSAKLAMYTLPSKENLLKQVCGEENVQMAIDMLPRTLAASFLVHQRIEKLYTLHDLHNLP